MLDRVLFVVAAPLAEVAPRAGQLARLYGGELWMEEVRGAVAGCIGPRRSAAGEPGTLTFGTPLLGATVDWRGEHVRIETGPVDVTTIYKCGPAWSTHATTAAHLATGAPRIRREAVAELAALGFVPGEATTLEGVSAVPAGAVVELGATTPPPPSTPTPPPPTGAAPAPAGPSGATPVGQPASGATPADAEARFVAALRDWTAGHRTVTLGLSGGLDSRAVAVGLLEAGVAFDAVTWGSPEWADVAEARRVAEALGVPHRVVEPLAFRDDAAASDRSAAADFDPRAARARAVWADGAAPITAPGADPAARGVHVTGAGGEIARAFYSRLLARGDPSPSLDSVAALWRPASLLRDAAPPARDAVEAATRAMLDRAAASGARGWDVLDRVYAGERMRKWGRAMLPPAAGAYAPAFLHPDLVPALLALPLEDRLTAALHRRVIARRLPEPPPPPQQRAAIPRLLRRLAARRRARADPFGGGTPGEPPALHGARGAAPPPPGGAGPHALAGAGGAATLHAALAAVADAPLVRDALGDAFADRLKAALAHGSPRAAEVAGFLAGVVAFADALDELRRPA